MAKKDKGSKNPTDEAEDDKVVAKTSAPEGEEGEGGDSGKKKTSKKFVIIGGLIIVLLVAAGAGAYFTGMLGGGKREEEAQVKEKAVYYTMPEMIINLAAPGKNASFLKASVILELPHALDAVTVENNLPRLMDAFNTYVRELRPSDLSGSAGITRLREELLLRANKALEPTKINDVLFKEIVVQ